jgi:hypothetical protein
MAYTYNPDFSRDPKGKFNLDNNFVSIKNGSKTYLLEDELNEMQWIQNEQRAQSMRNIFNSGFLYNNLSITDTNSNNDGTIYIKGYGNADLTSSILFNIKNYIDVNINGYIFKLAGSYKKDVTGANTTNNNILISLPTAPTSGTRYDMVCLEVWFEEINNTTNKTIKAYGGVSNAALGDLNMDARTNVETTHRIQLKWNITVAQNAQVMTSVSPRNNVLNSRYITATSVAGKTYCKDPNLFVSLNNSGIVDGTYYSIPILLIKRGTSTIALTDITNLAGPMPFKINTFAGDLTFNGNLTFNKTTTFNDPVKFEDTATFYSTTTFNNTNTFNGISTFNDDINAKDQIVLNGATLKGVSGTLQLKNSADSTFYDVWNNNNATWDKLLNRPLGATGQTYFINEDSTSNIKVGYTLYKANIVTGSTELTNAKSTAIDFSKVFSTWYRFSHFDPSGTYTDSTGAVITGAALGEQEKLAWTYDSVNNKVVCTVNSQTYIGFISNEKYLSYTHEATLSSIDGDDDMIGVIIAFVKDNSGNEYTLSAVRTPNLTNQTHVAVQGTCYHWALAYNYDKPDQKLLGTIAVPGDTTGGWSSFPTGTRIRVIRNGDSITISTAAMNSTAILDSTKISINLTSDPLLAKFRGECAYGYSCLSQNASTFSDIYFAGGLQDIYDVSNNQVWVKSSSGTWSINTSKTISGEIGIGKFAFNETTGKLYYIKGENNIILCNPSVLNYTSDGGILFDKNNVGINWARSTDGGAVYMNIDQDDSDNHMVFETRDNGTEWFRWQHVYVGGSITEWMSLKNDGLRVFNKKIDSSAGPSSSRPTVHNVGDAPYFDTSINKPIWWNGSRWVDAMGNSV